MNLLFTMKRPCEHPSWLNYMAYSQCHSNLQPIPEKNDTQSAINPI